jgi:hypothetical protein
VAPKNRLLFCVEFRGVEVVPLRPIFFDDQVGCILPQNPLEGVERGLELFPRGAFRLHLPFLS